MDGAKPPLEAKAGDIRGELCRACDALGEERKGGAPPRSRSSTARTQEAATSTGSVGTREVVIADEVNGIDEEVQEWEDIELWWTVAPQLPL